MTNTSKPQSLLNKCQCAEADLIGAKQARDQMDIEVHDWGAHEASIDDISDVIDFFNDGLDYLCNYINHEIDRNNINEFGHIDTSIIKSAIEAWEGGAR